MTVQGKPGRSGRPMAMLLGHYSTRVMMVAISVAIIDDILGQPGGVLAWFLAVPWIAWIAALFLDFSYHEHQLCERCIASSPLDPEAAVRRWKPALRWHHLKALKIVMLAAVLGWFVLKGRLSHPAWWVYALDVTAFVLLAASYIMGAQHRRLYPWCPYCRWDDGGDEESVPDVPAPAAHHD